MKDQRQQKINSLIYPKYDPKAYVLGAERSAPFEVINESGDWRQDLPDDEIQVKRIESNGCTNFGSLNITEILIKYIYKITANYSERFQAVMSGQNRAGNDPHKVMESIRNDGVIAEDELPFAPDMTFEEYLSPRPMTRALKVLGRKWKRKYDFKHEYIYKGKISLEEKKCLIKQALKRSPVGASMYAWLKKDGIYIKPEGVRDTHWGVIVAVDEEKDLPIVYDSYAPHLKTLTWDHFDIAKGVYLKHREKINFIDQLLHFLKSIFRI